MDYSWIDDHANEYATALNGRLFAGISCNRESIHRTSSTEDGMILTLVISGEGQLEADGENYRIEPGDTLLISATHANYAYAEKVLTSSM